MSVLAGIPRQLLVATDSFKSTFSAAAVADAIADGVRDAGLPALTLPAADGGEGTLAALRAPLALQPRRSPAHDPLGREIEAEWALGRDGVAVVEVAAASGFGLVAAADRDALAASSYGTGELLLVAAQAGAREILIAAGGSATSDGGAGALAAIADGGGLGAARLTVLCDVRTSFEQAAVVFGPQKGASPAQVLELSDRLDAQARALARDPRGVTGGGAAGGLAGGLWAALGAELAPGAQFVLGALGFDLQLRRSLAVITGEGRLDRQSLAGKLVGEVATRARQAGVPCHAVVGQSALDPFDARILDLQLIVEASTLPALRVAGAEIAQTLVQQLASGR